MRANKEFTRENWLTGLLNAKKTPTSWHAKNSMLSMLRKGSITFLFFSELHISKSRGESPSDDNG